MATVRITEDLAEIVRRTCEACGLDVSSVCQRVCRSLETHPLSHKRENCECVTSAGRVRLRWRGELPEGVTAQAFRERLYDKCADALEHTARVEPFSTPLVEGRDYIVKEGE